MNNHSNKKRLDVKNNNILKCPFREETSIEIESSSLLQLKWYLSFFRYIKTVNVSGYINSRFGNRIIRYSIMD